MARKITSASGQTSAANTDIMPAIKAATTRAGDDTNQVGAFNLKEIELYTDVATNIKINNQNASYMANITAIVFSDSATSYTYKISLSEDQVQVSKIEIVSASTINWAATFIF